MRAVGNVEQLYDKLMNLLVSLAEHGVIHCDVNEFNLLLREDTEEPVLIDLPQMISTAHVNAKFYFDRDVHGITDLFRRRFHYESELSPSLDDIKRSCCLDAEVAASGFSKEMATEFDAAALLVEDAESESADEIANHDELIEAGGNDVTSTDQGQADPSSLSDPTAPTLEDSEIPSPPGDPLKGITDELQTSRIDCGDVPSDEDAAVADDNYSIVSTIPPERIRARVKASLQYKAKQQRRIRAKAESSKVTSRNRDDLHYIRFCEKDGDAHFA